MLCVHLSVCSCIVWLLPFDLAHNKNWHIFLVSVWCRWSGFCRCNCNCCSRRANFTFAYVCVSVSGAIWLLYFRHFSHFIERSHVHAWIFRWILMHKLWQSQCVDCQLASEREMCPNKCKKKRKGAKNKGKLKKLQPP